MTQFEKLEELLKKYKMNKARIEFLENHLQKFTPESHNDFIQYKMFSPGYTGTTPKFVMEKGREVAELNKVEAAAFEYREQCEKEYRDARTEMEKELMGLRYCIFLIDDGLAMLERIDDKYRMILEHYYIERGKMEDIADSLHLSRGRCYELGKEGMKLLERILFGEKVPFSRPGTVGPEKRRKNPGKKPDKFRTTNEKISARI